jgi:hypothetical protein
MQTKRAEVTFTMEVKMMRTVGVYEAKSKLSALLGRVSKAVRLGLPLATMDNKLIEAAKK